MASWFLTQDLEGTDEVDALTARWLQAKSTASAASYGMMTVYIDPTA